MMRFFGERLALFESGRNEEEGEEEGEVEAEEGEAEEASSSWSF